MEEEGYDADSESEIESTRPDSISGHASGTRPFAYQNRTEFETSHCQHSVVEEIYIMYPGVIKFVLHSMNQILPALLALENTQRYVLLVEILLD